MTDRFDPNIPADPANPAAPSIEGDFTGIVTITDLRARPPRSHGARGQVSGRSCGRLVKGPRQASAAAGAGAGATGASGVGGT
jgi:hypothetical protein